MTTYQIELNNTYANREFSISFDEIENSIHILLQTINDALFMSLFVNDEQLGQAFICLPDQLVVPYPYIQEILGGNFVFKTEDGNYPNFENFGKTCNLFFITADEL